MRDPGRNRRDGQADDRPAVRRELDETLLRARLAARVARQVRPACVGARHKDFLAFVAAVVGWQMQAYAALPPS